MVEETKSGISQRRWTEEELEEMRFLYTERAAIKEFCANVSRDQAEAEAWDEIYGRKPGEK